MNKENFYDIMIWSPAIIVILGIIIYQVYSFGMGILIPWIIIVILILFIKLWIDYWFDKKYKGG